MRIISGKSRGTKLYTLQGKNTRPTLDRVKESLFNIIQNRISNCVFLDLFAGSGAIGLEAASRGAKKVILSDSSKEAIDIIKKNTIKTHCEECTEIYNKNFQDVLNNKINEKVDVIYIDPPYETNFAYEALKEIINRNILKESSIVIIETDQEDIIGKIEKLKIDIYDKRKYGRANLIFLKKK